MLYQHYINKAVPGKFHKYFRIKNISHFLTPLHIFYTKYRWPSSQLMRYLTTVLRFKLINSLMKFGSTIFRLTVCGYLFTHTQSHMERGDGVAMHVVRAEVYASPSQ